jgi:hypothetical protein
LVGIGRSTWKLATMRNIVVVVLLLLSTVVVAGSIKAKSVAEAWRMMPTKGSACGDDLSFDYELNGGMRNFFCRALTVYSWRDFLAGAPVAPFRKGPHRKGKLNLKAERDFGHYDPKFVAWATTTLIPAADQPELRSATQGIYDTQVKELAHVYFLVDKMLSADPKWIERERQRYLVSMEAKGGGWDVWEITGTYHDVLGGSDSQWGGHDPNHVRSAVMWWLRRHHDETASLWRGGLLSLLKTYDAAWLAQQQKTSSTTKLPSAPVNVTPEYRQ